MEKKKVFIESLNAIGVPEILDRDLLFDAYMLAFDGAKNLKLGRDANLTLTVNPLNLLFYLINEHSFYLSTHNDKKQEELKEDEQYISFLASVALDKYCTNEHLAYQTGKLTNRFSPYMSTIDLYLNFILGMLARYKKNDPKETLVIDVMTKGFQMGKCVATLLEEGFETEAFATWRTLHENESILHVIVKSGQPAIDAYLRHMKYAAAFRGTYGSKEEIDAVFVEIKAKMREHDLKSKDMKRFIEYGWIIDLDIAKSMEGIKLNFRDGVEKLAGLENYSKVYEMSSEIAHSSPLLIYSRKDYIFHIALINLYESFFRLEKIFSTLYLSSIQEDEKGNYLRMRQLYYGEIVTAYKVIQASFAKIGEKHSNNK